MIIPSIIAKSQKELDERLKKVKSFKTIHLDVMDGKFVKNRSLQFNFKLPKNKKFEAHLMIENPKKWIEKNKHKVNNIIVHYESKNNISEILTKKIGISINPRTKVEKIKPYLNIINKVLIMTVTPGKYGSKFLNSSIKKIKEIKKINPKIKIEVDGGINPKTIKKIDADSYIVGSYLQNSGDIKKAIKELKN
jgi:ribulose-phosphate 3-epimerase